MERWEAKVISIVIVFVLPVLFCMLPHFLGGFIESKGSRGKRVLCLLMCYGGGIFFGTFLLHMGPEVRYIIDTWLLKPYAIDYPLSDFIIGCGFFFVLFAEKIVMRINKRRVQRKDQRLRKNCIMYQRNDGGGFVCRSCSAGKPCDGFDENMEHNTNFSSRISIQVADIEDRGHVNQSLEGCVIDEISITERSVISDDSGQATTTSSTSLESTAGDEKGADKQDKLGSTGIHGHHHHRNNNQLQQQQQQQSELDTEATHHNVRSLILIMALSLHHIFEGMTLGLQRTVSNVFTLLIALMCHETIISFSLGLQFVKCKYTLKRHIVTSFCCCIIMPIGVAIGTIMTEVGSDSEALEITNGVLQAFSSGTFIFVTFFEILQEEIDPHDTSIGKIACVMGGFMTMALLVLIPEEHKSQTAALTNSTNSTVSAFNYTAMVFGMTTDSLGRFGTSG